MKEIKLSKIDEIKPEEIICLCFSMQSQDSATYFIKAVGIPMWIKSMIVPKMVLTIRYSPRSSAPRYLPKRTVIGNPNSIPATEAVNVTPTSEINLLISDKNYPPGNITQYRTFYQKIRFPKIKFICNV
jgi:hypothetical protein